MYIPGFLLSGWGRAKRMQFSSFVSFCLKKNKCGFGKYLHTLLLSVKLVWNLWVWVGFFSKPFFLFISRQETVSLSMVINRVILLLLLQRPGETSSFAACSSRQHFLFLTSNCQKATAGDSHQKWRGEKKKKISGKVCFDFAIWNGRNRF